MCSIDKKILFEVSWEVCNKVGGIYTVISSKVPHINQNSDYNYCAIGPYLHHRMEAEFLEEPIPEQLIEVFNSMKNEGLICHYGRWLVKSEPQAILIDFQSLYSQKNEIKKKLWDNYHVDSLNAPFDFDEPVVFSVAVAKFIDKYQRTVNKKITAQFHEWMTGAGLLWIKAANKNVATVFTTHATVLGRSIVSQIPNFYSVIKTVDVEEESKRNGVVAKHQIEKASAQNTDVFTTVSAITGLEAEHILGRKPDVILPNGLDLENFPSFEDASIKHSDMKHHIKDFIMSFFFPFYSFELDDTLIFFIFGRYEFENKGIDIFIEALGRLNSEMKKQNSQKTVVTFFFIPAGVYGINHNILENKTKFNDIKTYVEHNIEDIKNKLTYLITAQDKLSKETIFDEHFLTTIKKKMLQFAREGTPPYSTHDLKDESKDSMVNGFKRAQLNNHEADNVKVILYPAYLRPADNLLNLEVYEAIIGGHLGVFPSVYEPWGYTPLEAAALGVASVTTDLAGFGIYVEPEVKTDYPGVFVVKRFGKNHEESTQGLFDVLKRYVSLTKEERIQNKIEARRIANLADWKNLVKYYKQAYSIAESKIN